MQKKPYLGLTNYKGIKPTKKETEIAKNFLNQKELNILNRMVTAYLEMAELQALNRKPMCMKAWVARLDDFLIMTGNEILNHSGTVSHNKALEKAHVEYEKFREKSKNELSEVEKDFIKKIDRQAKQLKNMGK
ncbi:MAG: RhuM family protein [Cyclobacteriaceae bacterium]